MNVISIRRTVPQATPVTAPLQVLIELPGPYLTGIQVWTSDALFVSDISLRLVEPPGALLFPEPSANVLTPLTELADPKWYNPIGWEWVNVRLVVSGGPRYRLILDLVNGNAQAGVIVIVNLLASVQPPDQTALELMRGMNQGLLRFQSAAENLTAEMVKVAMQSQLKVAD